MKSLDFIKVRERDNSENEIEFFFNDDMQGNNLKRENLSGIKKTGMKFIIMRFPFIFLIINKEAQ